MIALVGLYLLTTQSALLWRRYREARPRKPARAMRRMLTAITMRMTTITTATIITTTISITITITRTARLAIILSMHGSLRGPFLAQGRGGGAFGRHQAMHGRDPRAGVCADARIVLGRRGGDLRHGARHRHHRSRAGDARAQLARAGAQARRDERRLGQRGVDRVRHRWRCGHLPVRPSLFLASLGPARPF